MFSVFNDVLKQVRFKKEHPTIETWVFQSMKGAMVGTLLGCALVTAKTYVGDNINCVTGFSGQEHKAIETYCFISSTYSMINVTAPENPYPGLGTPTDGGDDSLRRHAYYQWVPMVLALQAIILYFPRWLWKNVMDKSKFQAVLGNLDMLHIGGEKTPKHVSVSAAYMAQSLNTHWQYALQFLLCEMFAFCIALGNLFITNAFLGGGFFRYGRTALSYLGGDITDMDNPLNEVFPKIAKCVWHKFGPTGSIQTFDAMCVLPLNIVNEKTYVMLWLVYIVSFTVLSAVLLYHIALVISGALRDKVIAPKLTTPQTRACYEALRSSINYGDWFFLYNLSCRMRPAYFECWLQELTDNLDRGEPK